MNLIIRGAPGGVGPLVARLVSDFEDAGPIRWRGAAKPLSDLYIVARGLLRHNMLCCQGKNVCAFSTHSLQHVCARLIDIMIGGYNRGECQVPQPAFDGGAKVTAARMFSWEGAPDGWPGTFNLTGDWPLGIIE